jgi:hypothetical protein
MAKVQTNLYVPLHIRQRAERLALVRDETLAEVFRAALAGDGLAGLETLHADLIAELDAMAKRLGTTGLELAQDALKEGHSLAEVRALAA